MKKLNRKNFPDLKKYPNKVIQFGEGNFLRCFIDWQLDIINEKTDLEAGIFIVRPIDTDYLPLLNSQDGLYTSIIRGINENKELINEKRIITSVNEEVNIYKNYDRVVEEFKNPNIKYLFSNTTEAGIVFNEYDKLEDRPQVSFPGKLTKLLFERYCFFNGEKDKGLIILPCELIDYNGEELKKIVLKYAELWSLESEFIKWLEEENTWCSTLVDRIVTGYPKDEKEDLEKELGYSDDYIVAGEYFHLFVIQGPKWLEEEFKINKTNLNIKIVDNIKPYKERKVGILNGAHTALVPVSYLYGNDTVKESMDNQLIKRYLEQLLNDEIIPALDMDKTELEEFANSVMDRFNNPYIRHQLLSISLNSMFKFKTRILPQLLTNTDKLSKFPKYIAFSLASLICFYRGIRGEEFIPIKDEDRFIEVYSRIWKDYDSSKEKSNEIAREILGMKDHWDKDLNEVQYLTKVVGEYIFKIQNDGIKKVLEEIL
ncbi:MAG: tagaturonate reductase [Fusobacteriaceae bacterium]